MDNPKKILCVDDDPLMRRSVAALLRKRGFEDIITAGDGREGLEKFREHHPDLTILDLRMPELDGLEFLEAVQEELAETPVIILSGAGGVDDVIRSLQLGAWDYVLKPITDFSILEHSIHQAFERADLVRENKRYQEYLEEEVEKRTRELYHAQKLEAIGTLAGGIAHDFNNLLATIIGYTEMAREQLPEDSQPARDLENVLTAAGRATELVRQILTFSRQGEMEVHPVYVQDLLKQLVKLARSTFPSSIEIRDSIDTTCQPIPADTSQLQQVVMNLLTNAKQALDENVGTISVSLARVDSLPEDVRLEPGQKRYDQYLKISVADTGRGIEKKEIEKIFEPFYTTKPMGEGTGLGLSVAHGIVGGMEGVIHVESTPGQGTEMQVYLPVVDVLETGEESGTAEAVATGNERILVVDDDPAIADIMNRVLTGLGYRVTAFTDSEAALEGFRADPEGFDLVLTDMTMPRLTGKDLAIELLKIRPDIPVVMCTGYSEVIDSKQAREIGIRKLLMKPIIKDNLARVVRSVLDNG
ncbi:MAG: hypothetical protein Kow0089_24560 [Desulfobulbaceae bacterium]